MSPTPEPPRTIQAEARSSCEFVVATTTQWLKATQFLLLESVGLMSSVGPGLVLSRGSRGEALPPLSQLLEEPYFLAHGPFFRLQVSSAALSVTPSSVLMPSLSDSAPLPLPL